MHRWAVEKTCESLDALYADLDVTIAKTVDAIQKMYAEVKKKYRKQEENAGWDDLVMLFLYKRIFYDGFFLNLFGCFNICCAQRI